MADTKPSAKSTKVEAVKSTRITAEGGVYFATKKGYFGMRLYKVGQGLKTQKGDKIPAYFSKKKPATDDE